MKKFFVLFLTLFGSFLSANPYEESTSTTEQELVDRCRTPTDLGEPEEKSSSDKK